jgi:hypothetical protein
MPAAHTPIEPGVLALANAPVWSSVCVTTSTSIIIWVLGAPLPFTCVPAYARPVYASSLSLPKRHKTRFWAEGSSFSRGDLHSLVQPGLAWRTYNPVGLRTLHLGAGMIDILHRQVQLRLVAVRTATVLGPPIRQEPAQRHFVGIEEGPHLVSEQISRRQCGLPLLELGKG